jgi:ATP-binding cassette subfamily B protein
MPPRNAWVPSSASVEHVQAWKNEQPVDLVTSGGHDAGFPGRRVFPFNFLLRHYRSGRSSTERKVFDERQSRYPEEELDRGWHHHYQRLRHGHQFVRDPDELVEFVDGEFHSQFLLPCLARIGVPLPTPSRRARTRAAAIATMRRLGLLASMCSCAGGCGARPSTPSVVSPRNAKRTAAPRGAQMSSAADQPPQSLRRLLAPLLAGSRSRLVVLAVVSLVSGLAEAGVLVLIARIGVALTAGSSRIALSLGPVAAFHAGIPTWLGVAAGLTLVKFGLQVWSARLAAALMARELARGRKSLFRLFLKASWGLQAQEREGHLQELMTTYANNAAAVLGALVQGITGLSTLAALLAAALAVNGFAALSVLVVITLLLTVLRPFRKGVRRRSGVAARAQLDFATALTESTLLAQEIRIFNAGDHMQRRMEASIDAHSGAFLRARFLGGILPTFYQSAALAFIVAALGVAYAVRPGDLASLGAVLLVVIRSLSQGQLLQSVYQYLHESAPYLDTLETEAEAYRGTAVESEGEPVGRIRAIAFEHVWFEYERGHPVLRDISFRASRGEVIGIVGPSGSGKSTLVQILLRLRQPASGRVVADDRAVDGLSLDEWYERVTFVPQEPRLFSASVADNIRFFREGIADTAVERAARAAHLHDEVLGFPRGYETPAGERGGQLSGGQRQRVCIARALVGDPDVVVLDEPTSALDAKSELAIRETLTELASRAIVFVIAHRLSTLDACDRIMVLVAGELQGFDEPARLELDSAFYREALRLSGIR